MLLAVAVPLLALLGYLGYRFLSASAPPAPAQSPSARAPQPAASQTGGPETPPLEQTLLDAGYDRDRMRSDAGSLVLETFDPPEIVAHKLQEKDARLVARIAGDTIHIDKGGLTESVRIVELQRDTEDKSFDEVPGAPVKEKPTALPATRSGARIVLILDDVGFENQPLEQAASIDANLNFAVIPGSPRAREAAEMLASRGFEILCHLPMEPLDYPRKAPGDRAILVSMSNDEITARTREDFRAIPHARGVNNHMGSRATRDRRVMESVAAVLKEENVYFIDSRTASNSLAAHVAREHGVPAASRDVFLDDDPSESMIRRQLAELAHIAAQKDFAVGIGHVYPSTIRVLLEEIPKLRASGIVFLHASDALGVAAPVERTAKATSTSPEVTP